MSSRVQIGSVNPPLHALTGARFLAAFSVVVFHYGRIPLQAASHTLATMAELGPAAVSFFYVLSGAVITFGCSGQDGAPARPQNLFWVQRATRILPAYLLALLLSIPPFSIHVVQIQPGAGGIVRIIFACIAGGLLLQAYSPQLAVGLNTPGWSISCEAFFYALWPRLVTRFRRHPANSARFGIAILWLIGLAAPVAAVMALRIGLMPKGTFPTLFDAVSSDELLARTLAYFPLLRLPEFLIGVILGHALRQAPACLRSAPHDTVREITLLSMLMGASWLLGSGVVSSICHVTLADRIAIESGTLAPLFALIVWQLARGRGLVQRALALPTVVLLGEASYALYILQEPIMVWVTAVLKRTAPQLHLNSGLFFVGYATALVLLSVFVHKFVEIPLRGRALRWYLARQRFQQSSAT
jgi:peptidoglycan/LPS O-acetylase OafA/YrhL